MSESKNTSFVVAAVFLVIVCLGAAYWFMFAAKDKKPDAPVSIETSAELVSPTPTAPQIDVEEMPSVAEVKPEVLKPAAPTPEPEPALPSLNKSDSELKTTIRAWSNGQALLNLLVDDQLIRKSVRMVHGVSEGFVVKEYRPAASPSGRFLVDETGQTTADGQKYYSISEKNLERYQPYLNLITVIEPAATAELYRKYYPLLQQAYEELGLQRADFHNVMLKALDEFLKPTVSETNAQLRRPSVMYIFDDKRIESTNGVNKLKLRLGEQQVQSLQKWVTELRLELENIPL